MQFTNRLRLPGTGSGTGSGAGTRPGRRPDQLLQLLLAVLLPLFLAGQSLAQGALDGQRMYREGISPSGTALKALGAGQSVLSGKEAACANCHRRSGYGSTEGAFSARPITGPALFEEQTLAVRSPRIKAQLGSRQRPAYTEALLARALRSGLDASGKPLDALMPRYALADADVNTLAAYLAGLSAQPSPGVDEEQIHFATVIQPGVAPERRRAMLDVMQAFFRDKGANMRQDESRREAGTMRMYRSYRKWVLHVWELSGPSEGWDAQLQTYYRQQPVFALLGGLGTASWRPIHAFAESQGLPSVFAQVNLPEVTGANDYNLYLSGGVALEAQVLAKYLQEQNENGPLVQIYRRDAPGLAAAAALRQALGTGAALQDRVLEDAPDATFWQALRASQPAALVLWLDAKTVDALAEAGSAPQAAPLPQAPSPPLLPPVPLYLGYEAAGGKLPLRAQQAGANLRLVYPSDLSPRHESRLLRSKIWLHNKGLALTDESLQTNTLFALTVASDALGHMMDSFSRDYFIERVEHVVGQTPMPSIYQSVSLGPGQRFAAKGASIVQLEGAGMLKPLSPWIVP